MNSISAGIKHESERQEFLATVREFYNLAKSLMPDRLVMSNDGLVMEPTDMVSAGRSTGSAHPLVRHEFGAYYCTLPDVGLIPMFTGVMEPTWLAQKSVGSRKAAWQPSIQPISEILSGWSNWAANLRLRRPARIRTPRATSTGSSPTILAAPAKAIRGKRAGSISSGVRKGLRPNKVVNLTVPCCR